MIQRSVSTSDEVLAAIADAIVAELRPSRVILFGSRARGDARPDSDYDLVIELAHDVLESEALRGRARSAIKSAASDVAVDVMLRQPGQIESRCNDPGYMDWDIAREGLVVYPLATGESASVVKEGDADGMQGRPYASIADWLARAEEDRRDIQNNLAAGREASWSAVCFHSQQLAEKYLKALIVRAGVRPPRTHVVMELVAVARQHGHELRDLEGACAILKEFAVAVRYPEHVPIPSEAKGRDAWAAAQLIADAVKAELS
jgi:HEPN domain-containing protein/predicted nucleotidyltransferase